MAACYRCGNVFWRQRKEAWNRRESASLTALHRNDGVDRKRIASGSRPASVARRLNIALVGIGVEIDFVLSGQPAPVAGHCDKVERM